MKKSELCYIKYGGSRCMRSTGKFITNYRASLKITLIFFSYNNFLSWKKGKSVPLKAWSGPEGSRKFKVPRLRGNGTW
jgi:hypothetical protein